MERFDRVFGMLWAMEPDPSQLKSLLQAPELSALMKLAPKPDCYLVGGAIRNLLCGEPVHDFDLATAYDPTPLARNLAESCCGHWFWLDRSRCQSRVLLVNGNSVDFAPFRGRDLTADLRERDFTINAMALNLSATDARLADPLNGLADLHRRYLRCCSDTVLVSDPLRVLRGCRFVGHYGLKVVPETLGLLQQATGLLSTAAGERVRNELGLLLRQPVPDVGLQLMGGLGLLPEGEPGSLTQRWQVWGEALGKTGALRTRLEGLLKESVSDQLDRLSLLRLAELQPLLPEELPLTLSRRNQKLLDLLRQLFAAPPQWADYWRVGTRARLRRLQDWAPDPLLLVIAHWLASGASTADLTLLAELLDLALDLGKRGLADLLNGDELQAAFALEAGPELGEVLSQLRRAEWLGLVETREQGLAYLRQRGQKDVDKG